jgi:hypothetical protein
MVGTYLYWDSTDAAIRQARRLIRFRPDAAAGWSVLVEPLLREERLKEAEAALVRVSALTPNGTSPGPALNRDRIRWGRLDEADRELQFDLHSSTQSIRFGGRWLLLLSLRNQARLREALALAKEGRVPGSNQVVAGVGEDGIHMAFLPYEMGEPRVSAERFRRLAERDQALPRPIQGGTVRGCSRWRAGTPPRRRQYPAAADSVEVISWGAFSVDLLHHFLRRLLLQRMDGTRKRCRSFGARPLTVD